MAGERDHSGGDADLDAAFAEIIAGWDDVTTDPVPRWPASEDTDPPSERPPSDTSMEQIRYVRDHGLPTPAVDPEPPVEPRSDDSDGSDGGDGAPRAVPPTAGPRDWELADTADDHYVPPDPPPLPRTDLITALAWAGVLLGPVFLLGAGLFWPDVSRMWLGLAATAFIGGFCVLVLRLPPTREADDDDGAVV